MDDPMNPFFSIVIPVLNSERFIDRCVKSLNSQSFVNFEIIFVDGISKDGTLEKIQQYSTADSRIKLLQQPCGIYQAMNIGIENSTGSYLYFMGADDVLFNDNVLKDIAEEIQSASAPDLVYGNVLLGNSNRVHNGEYDLSKLFFNNICHQSIFYARSVFTRVGKYDLTYPSLSDWHFNFRCFATRGLRMHYVSRLVAIYALDGFSSKNPDPLDHGKRELFMTIARRAEPYQRYILRRNTIRPLSVRGRLKYLYYHVLAAWAYLFRRRQ